MKDVLHIFPDDKFFDSVSDFFDSIPNIKNVYAFCESKDYRFKYIKNTQKIVLYPNRKDYLKLIHNADIIFLHSLCEWNLFNHFRKDTKIIWWSWGYDIYEPPTYFTKAILDITLYKPKTELLLKRKKSLVRSIINILKSPIHLYYKIIINRKISEILRRIDYFTPVLPIEYDLLLERRDFNAKPFCIESGPGLGRKYSFIKHESLGYILIGNSYTPTNNHIDVFETLKNCDATTFKYIIPVNYGWGYPISKDEFKSRYSFSQNILWLDDFISYEKYVKLQESVSHAIFGFLRQQGLGNIYLCLAHGVKIFLYKSGLVYQDLLKQGFRVYSIEDDLSQESLSEPLNEIDAIKNYNLLQKLVDSNHIRYVEAFERI